MSQPLARAVERLADAVTAHNERDRRAEIEAEIEAIRRPLKHMGSTPAFLATLMRAGPQGVFTTPVPRARWAVDTAGLADIACACGKDLRAEPRRVAVCECGRAFLMLDRGIYVDYSRNA